MKVQVQGSCDRSTAAADDWAVGTAIGQASIITNPEMNCKLQFSFKSPPKSLLVRNGMDPGSILLSSGQHP